MKDERKQATTVNLLEMPSDNEDNIQMSLHQKVASPGELVDQSARKDDVKSKTVSLKVPHNENDPMIPIHGAVTSSRASNTTKPYTSVGQSR